MEKIKFDCKKCGFCCETLFEINPSFIAGLSLFPEESKEFESKFVKPFIAKGNDKPNTILLFQVTVAQCPHLDNEKGCKIYPNRPLVCKAFPYIYRLWGTEVGSKCSQIGHNPNYRENSFVEVDNPQIEEAIEELETKIRVIRDNLEESSKFWIFDLASKKWLPADF